jgi:transposase
VALSARRIAASSPYLAKIGAGSGMSFASFRRFWAVAAKRKIRGLAIVFGIRLPRALTAAFIDNALKASEGIAGLSAAMRGLIAARTAVMTAVAAIGTDMRRMTRASAACNRLMTIPGVGQLTALTCRLAIIMHAMPRDGTEFVST